MQLADLCTLRVGGEARRFLLSTRRDELIQAIAQADAVREPLLFLGGGSNLVPVDGEFPGLVLRDGREDVRVLTLQEFSELRAGGEQPSQGREPDTELRPDASRGIRDAAAVVAKAQQLAAATPSCIFLSVSGGLAWDRLVEYCVTQEFSGLEALSGIPGVVGAAPVQNIGAYGGEVADCLLGVTAWDRQECRLVYLSAADFRFGYRDSLLKQSRLQVEANFGTPQFAPARPGTNPATGRWIVLEVDFALQRGGGTPVRYAQLAGALGVPMGTVVPAAQIRTAVLELRRSKGMVLDPSDHDTWSVGSFFTNPILPVEATAALDLPENAPRWEAALPGRAGEVGVKLSAAWLIEHSGIMKGFALPGAGAGVSTKHVLALTNRGNATAADIQALASHIIAAVQGTYGVTLVPEPVIL
ncbi:UDP-N-acetylmuramate dehydrogenase [uncultured Mobiluncus sp.]|uniref:UDP-N-acetylmuramate dehydrogenase n=1 Tax=uncultured Mobiluncus sp. TaxID=293425 RepID=UPI0025EA62BA|nr:UDP-N-acetylmuramate dehydrogenase [uncultured Mobiluncus sp.]